MNNISKKGSVIVIALAAMFVGILGGSYLKVTNANAETNITTADQPMNFDPAKGGHTANGKTEEILTGDNAQKAKDTALKAVPGGTVDRVETDAEGDVYEAHMTKADGTYATVKFDANFNVTKTEEGGPGGKPGRV